MGLFIFGFIVGIGVTITWAILGNTKKKNATYTTEDDDNDAAKDPFKTW